MIEAIVEWSLKNRFLVVALSLLLVAGGTAAMLTLPIDAVPDVTNVQVQILTSSPAFGPEEVERFVTTPVELAMSGLPGMEDVRSISRFGLSAVTVVFKDGTNIYFARQLVNERLQEARDAIPEGYGTPELGPVSTGLGEIYQFEVRGQGKSPMELRTILEWDIAPRLRSVPGVVEVNSFGGELKTYEVALRPEDMARYDVAVQDVTSALRSNNANSGGAYIVKNAEQYLVRAEGLITTTDDIADVVVKTDAHGTPVRVRELADVRFAPLVRQGAVTRDGRGEAVTGIVMLLLGGNSHDVVTRVAERVAEMKPTLAKLGVTIEPFYDRTELVNKTIHTVARSLAEGGLLVIVILFLMLRNLRAGLIVSSVIPLAMLFTFIGMRYLGVSGNLMSLGLEFGSIVDGAVIVVENAVRMIAERSHKLGRPLEPQERSNVVLAASREVLRSATFGVAIIAIVYLPILSLTGIEGKMFGPRAVTVLLALAGALVLALTFVPALASMLLPLSMSEEESPLVSVVRRRYEPLLQKTIRKPVLTLGIAVTGFLLGIAILPFLGAEFVPRLGEGSLAIQFWRPPSIALEESIRQTTEMERVLLKFPEITTVVSKTGRAEIATDPMGVETSDVLVMLKPADQWTTAKTQEGLVEAFDRALKENLPGGVFSYSQPIELRVAELISGVRSDVALKIYGSDLFVLKRAADAAVGVLSKVRGAADVKAEQTAGLPVLRVKIDRAAVARYGINASDVLEVISAVGGQPVGVVAEGLRRFDMQVRFAPEARSNPEALGALRARASNGELIPISQLAELRVEDGPAQISHDGGRRRITVEMNVRGRDLAGFVADAQRAIESSNVVPGGYFTEWGGQFQNLQAATRRLSIVVPIALALIFAMLFMSFGSAKLAALIYLNVPFAVTGGIFALAMRGMPLSISAGVGFIALFGIAVLNGLVLASYIRQRQLEGADAATAAFDGARIRLRPVLMTALVSSLGFIPMAISNGVGAEVQKPLATVVIGGLITSTLLTLLVLPTVYAWWFRDKGTGDVPAGETNAEEARA